MNWMRGMAVSKGFQYRHKYRRQKEVADQRPDQGILASWNPASSRADVVVANDGSGDYRTVMDAIASLTKRNCHLLWARSRSSALIVYVKEGIYHEHVVIGRHLNHLMFVGDGIDGTIIIGSKRGFGELDDRKTFSSGISLSFLVLWFHCASLLLGLWESRWISTLIFSRQDLSLNPSSSQASACR